MDTPPDVQPFKYRAFISYSHSDERWAGWLHRALESYRVPRRLVGTVTEFGVVPGSENAAMRVRKDAEHEVVLLDQLGLGCVLGV